MEQISRIGMDTSKRFFQLHGVNAAEKVVLRKKLRRKEMVAFFKALAPTVIGIEACGASHHWARLLRSFGHEVKLIAPQLVKPYVKRGKNDTADAEALCEAMSRPTMRFVPVKTAEQQAALMMVALRDRLIRNRTQLSNAIRGYAAEFGFTAARGMAHIDPLLDRIQANENVPVLARELFAAQAEEYAQLQAQIAEVDAKLMAWHKADECSRRLAKIPGVGPIGAALLMMKTPAPEMFRSGRQFAAWIGLTPKDHSTAGKVRLGVITRAGDEALRSVLVVGATAVVQHVLVAGLVPGIERQPLKKLDTDEDALLKLLHRWRDEAVKAGWLRGEPHHCSMAMIPTLAEEDARRPNRERENLVGQRTRIVNRMKACLARFGIRNFKPTLRKASERLETLSTPEGSPLPPNTLAEMRRDMARLRFVIDQIKEIEAARLKQLEHRLQRKDR